MERRGDGVKDIWLVSVGVVVGEEGTVGGGLSKLTESSSLGSMSASPSRESRKEDGE